MALAICSTWRRNGSPLGARSSTRQFLAHQVRRSLDTIAKAFVEHVCLRSGNVGRKGNRREAPLTCPFVSDFHQPATHAASSCRLIYNEGLYDHLRRLVQRRAYVDVQQPDYLSMPLCRTQRMVWGLGNHFKPPPDL